MWIHIVKNDPTPLYEQVKRQIMHYIMSEQMKAHQELPSIRKLAMDSKTSVITIKRAYEDLEKEGWIYTRPGIGSYVSDIEAVKKKQEVLNVIEQKARLWIFEAKKAGLTQDEIKKLLQKLGL